MLHAAGGEWSARDRGMRCSDLACPAGRQIAACSAAGSATGTAAHLQHAARLGAYAVSYVLPAGTSQLQSCLRESFWTQAVRLCQVPQQERVPGPRLADEPVANPAATAATARPWQLSTSPNGGQPCCHCPSWQLSTSSDGGRGSQRSWQGSEVAPSCGRGTAGARCVGNLQ